MEMYESYSILENCEDYEFPAAFQNDNEDTTDCIWEACGFRETSNDTDCSFLKVEFLKKNEDNIRFFLKTLVKDNRLRLSR